MKTDLSLVFVVTNGFYKVNKNGYMSIRNAPQIKLNNKKKKKNKSIV